MTASPLSLRVLSVLIAAAALQGTVSGYTLTFFPLLLEHAGHSPQIVGLANSVQMGAILATTLGLPYFLHRLRLPALYMGACLTGAAAMAGLALFGDILVLHLLLRFVMGCCVSLLYIVLEYWLNAEVDAKVRGKVFGAYGMSIVVGMGLGPLAISQTGFDGFLPFLFGGVLFLLAASITRTARAHAPTAHLNAPPPIGLPFRFLRLAPALAAAGFLHGIVESGLYAFLPAYGIRAGLSELDATALLTCIFWGAILMQLVMGWLADRWHAQGTLLLAASINGIGTLALPFMLAQGGFWLWPYMLLWGGMLPTLYTLIATCIGHRYPQEKLANAVLAFILMYGLGSLVGANLAGAIITHITEDGLPLIMAIAYGGCVLVLLSSRQMRTQKGQQA